MRLSTLAIPAYFLALGACSSTADDSSTDPGQTTVMEDSGQSATGGGTGVRPDSGSTASTSPDAAISRDSGTTVNSGEIGKGDSGEAADSATSARDSGMSGEVDSGEPARDSGTTAVDSGEPARDSGTITVDSGEPARDSGTIMVDSGTHGVDSGPVATSPCGVLPVNPNATQQAKNLLCYLYSQYNNHVLSGQQETSWVSNPDVDTNYIFSTTGKYPAVRGGDYLYPNGTTTRAEAWWVAGGIPLLCYHMGAPTLSDTYQNAMTAVPGGINQVLTPGTAQYTSFLSKLDYAAGELAKLQSANVAVLWRPFHEAGGTWFWWSKEGGAQYVRLWTFMYDYFTNTKHLDNLVWMHPYDGTPDKSFYPGKALVDIGGSDTYATNPPFTSLFSSTKGIVGGTVPLALHETGTMPNPSTMFGSGNNPAPWILFNTWAGFETSANTPSSIQAVYGDSHTVTRDEVPSLK